MWIDQKARGEVVISWTGDGTDTLASEVAKRLPASATVRFEAADFTARELEAARAQVESFWQSASGVTMGITSLGADVAANRTVIGIDPYSDALARELQSRFGPAVQVRHQPAATKVACESRSKCPNPIKGGLQIYQPVDPSFNLYCTSGFMGRVNVNPVPGQWFLLTAGHCIKDSGGNGRAWFHNGVWIGSAVFWSFAAGADADIGIIRMNQMEFPTNNLFGNGVGDIRQMTSWIANGNQTLGALACRGGQASNNWLCGTITDVNKTVSVGGTNIDHMWRMSRPSVKGDSGGPVAANFAAMGFNSATDGTGTWYSTIDWSLTVSGYKPCRSNANPCG